MSRRPVRRPVQIASAIALSLGLVLASASTASAHEALSSTNPAEGATVTELAAVELVFTDEILDEPTSGRTEVLGPDGRNYETDCAQIDGAVMTTAVALGAAGEYRVLWRAVSGDGHPISAEYSFTYAPPAGAVAAAGSDGSVCGDDGQVVEPSPVAEITVAPTDLPSETPTDAAAADPASTQDQGAGVWVWVGVTAGVVALIALIAWLIAARRRKSA
ncbi:MAG: hypothetical protein DI630_17925 [Gordonia sp. (in: high G+C Gram-positive bacteria)]|jgi:methionine-rich copper-binding protein CopC|nr:MAG: hypothetical protein DI630_17925 [Gordonia sp. (in: high G+C Gram-positive bacteria)]